MGKPGENGRKPLYLEICDHILEEIRNGNLKPNQKLVPSEELQERFKVSKITTEKAFKLLMERGIIYRVPGKGSFISDLHEDSREISVRTKSIAFVCPALISHHIINILTGIEKVLAAKGHSLRLCLTNGSFETQERILRELQDDGIDGLIIYPVEGKYYDEEILRMKLSKFPFVLVDKHFSRIKTSYVISDNREGSYLGTKALLDKGHRKIAFISTYSPNSTSAIDDRVEGFLKAMGEAGVSDPDSLVLQGFDADVGTQLPHDRDHRRKLIDSIKTFLTANKDIGAILTISPGNMSHVVRALREMDPGQKETARLELALFDLDEFLDFNRTALLTINQPSREIGARAAGILLDQITDPERIQEVMLSMSIENA